MVQRYARFSPFACFVVLLGCSGGASPTAGGTAGFLHAGNAALSEIQVIVHREHGGTFQRLGYGVPDAEGTFRLMTTDASGPLVLDAGEYRCTLESIGAPVIIPKQYTSADTSPLKVTWTGNDQKLDLDIPPLKPLL